MGQLAITLLVRRWGLGSNLYREIASVRALAWLGVALILQTHFFLFLSFLIFFFGGREIPPSFPAVSALSSFLLSTLLP